MCVRHCDITVIITKLFLNKCVPVAFLCPAFLHAASHSLSSSLLFVESCKAPTRAGAAECLGQVWKRVRKFVWTWAIWGCGEYTLSHTYKQLPPPQQLVITIYVTKIILFLLWYFCCMRGKAVTLYPFCVN